MALFSIPNVEIVTFLFIVFTVLFGKKRALLAAFVFATIEILLWGFGTWILGYYVIWPIAILITDFALKFTKSEYVFAAIAGFFGLTFGLFFAVIESFFYGIAYGFTYWVSGIPFDIIHGASNFIIALFLFKPVVKTVEKAKDRMHIQ